MATSLGDQGVVFHIASFEHRFSIVLLLATFLSCTSSFYVSIASTSVNLTGYEPTSLVTPPTSLVSIQIQPVYSNPPLSAWIIACTPVKLPQASTTLTSIVGLALGLRLPPCARSYSGGKCGERIWYSQCYPLQSGR